MVAVIWRTVKFPMQQLKPQNGGIVELPSAKSTWRAAGWASTEMAKQWSVMVADTHKNG